MVVSAVTLPSPPDSDPLTPYDQSSASSSYASSDITSISLDDQPFADPFPEFLWMTTEEPHRSRRMAILKAHPEVQSLLHWPIEVSHADLDTR